MRIRGLDYERSNLSDLLVPEYETVILFPSEDAIELAQLSPQKPIQLIVADGNWRQAAKVNSRYPEFKSLIRVKISETNCGKQHLRREHFPNGMSTLEAIAKSIRILEGQAAGESLMRLYRAKLNATLVGRGLMPDEAR